MNNINIRETFLKLPTPILICNLDGYPTNANEFALSLFGIGDINKISYLDIFSILKIKDKYKKKLNKDSFTILDNQIDFEKITKDNIYITSKSKKTYFTLFIFLLESNEYVFQFYEKNILEKKEYSPKITDSNNYKNIYKELLEGLPNSIVLEIDENLKCKLAKGNLLKELKVSSKELRGKTLYEISYYFNLLLDEQIENIINCCKKALNGQDDYLEFEYNNRHITLHTSLINNGKTFSVIALFNEITKSKINELNNNDSFHFFEVLIESIPVPIFYKDINGLYLGANELFLSYVGIKREEFINKSVYDIFSKDMADIYNKADKDVFENKKKQIYESSFIHSDGYHHDVIFYKSPFFKPDNKIMGLLGIMFDITEQKKIEEKLKNSEQKYRMIIEDQTEIICRFLPNRTITFVNEAFCKFFDIKIKDAIGFDIINFLPNFTDEQMSIFISSFNSNNSIFKKVYTIELPNDTRYLYTTNRAFFDNEGKIVELQAVGQDITELKKIESELIRAKNKAEESFTLKSELLSIMNPEIKNSINTIISMTALLSETNLSKEQSEVTQIIKISCESLLMIINEILDFSNIELGKISFEKRPFDVKNCIEETFEIFEPKAREKGLELRYFIKQNVPSLILGDKVRFKQILLNLVDNAIKFTNEGEVFISVNTVKKEKKFIEIQFAIKDTGIGISDKKKDILLNDYPKLDSYSKYGNIGLGLIVAENLVKMMGGKIWFVSQEKEGSTFFFTIKTVESYESNDTENVETKSSIPLSNTLPLNILVAEDNPINQKMIIRMLSKMGYSPDYVQDGNEVLENLKNKIYDIIFMDVQMPEMDGIETTTKIRETYKKNKPIIIALTANSNQEDKRNCIGAGMNDYLSKPFSIEQIEHMLMRWGNKVKEEKNIKHDVINMDTLRKVTLINEDDEEDNIEFLLELIDTFITQTPSLIKKIKEYADEKDIEKLGKVAHTLKGSSLTIGANTFGNLCKNINEESKKGELLKVIGLLPNLDETYKELEATLLKIKDAKSYDQI